VASGKATAKDTEGSTAKNAKNTKRESRPEAQNEDTTESFGL
jgi:hypothetical protein